MANLQIIHILNIDFILVMEHTLTNGKQWKYEKR